MTTPGESIGPEKAPDIPELPEPDGDGQPDAEPPSGRTAPGDSEQQGSPVLDDSGQAMPGQAGEPA